MNRIYIFISYGHDDYVNRARLLYESLKKEDGSFVVWWDGNLDPSDDWVKTIDSKLNELIYNKPDSCFVYVVTPYSSNTTRNNFCIKEILKVSEGEVRIIPIKVVESSMPLLLGNLQWMDFTDCKFEGNDIDFKNRINDLLKIIKEGKELPRDGKQAFLHIKLEPCNYSLDLNKHLLNYVERPWLLEAVKSFIRHQDQKVLLLLGGPGTGKTAFSVWLSHGELSGHIAAWHLCQYNDKRTCSLRNAIKSIAFYLADRIKEYYDILDVPTLDKTIDEPNIDAGTLFKALILEPVKKIVTQEQTWVILIDALDEISSENTNELAATLSRYAKELPSWLKFVVTSRNDPKVTTYLNDISTIVDLDSESLVKKSEQDVVRYVDQIIGQDSPQNQQVLQNSGNNFLFAQLLCETIKNKPDYNLAKLPVGINGYYTDYMNRYIKDGGFNEKAEPMLDLILAAYEPLDNEVIFERLKKSCEWCNKRSIYENLIKGFGPLLKKSNNCLLPFHKSLSDWFLSEDNSFYRVYKEDGLDEMVNWGLEIIEDESPNKDDKMTCHFYRYLPHYMIESYKGKPRAEFISLYCDTEFWRRRHHVIGVDMTLSLLFEELALCSQKLRDELYKNEGFFKVLCLFSIDLFNKGYYSNLRKLGYSIELKPNMGDEYRLLAIRYYYINELYGDIDEHLQDFIQPYVDLSVQDMVLNELGQTYRKFGQLNQSAGYYRQSLGGNGSCHLTCDDQIYTTLNLSRVLFQLCDFDNAHKCLVSAVSLFDSNQWHESYIGSDFEFSARQLERAVRYVILEMEIYSLTMNDAVCQEELEWADELYSDLIKRDRYYSNHLISKIMYLIRCGKTAHIDDLIEECEKNIPSRYDGIRFIITKCLLYLALGDNDRAYNEANSQLQQLTDDGLYLIQKTELMAIINYCKGNNQPCSIKGDMQQWYEHYSAIIHQIAVNN